MSDNQISLFNISSQSNDVPSRNKLAGCLGVQTKYSDEREQNDYYATDPIAAEWLVKLENLNHNIWECACGEGNLSEVFVKHGFEVKSTDLIDRGYGTGGVDFLACNEHFSGDIITNPPYKLAEPFIEHALSLVDEGNKVCMFLKVQFLEGKNRRNLYENTPPKTVWVSSSRIQCSRKNADCNSGSMIAYAWYVWEKGYKGDTILKWFN